MKSDYLMGWLLKAGNDLKVAENEMVVRTNEIITEAICFHCQQAAEKYLKAYLVIKRIEFGKTHNLELLREKCTKVDGDFKVLELGNLSDYAVDVRYPDESYIPTLEEARECLRLANGVKELVLRKIEMLDEH